MDRHSLASRSVQQINLPALTVNRAGEITLCLEYTVFFLLQARAGYLKRYVA